MIEIVNAGRGKRNQWRVALGAIVTELPLVIILVAVTTGSLARSIDLVLVAADAIGFCLEFAVSAQQRKARVVVMVERCGALSTLDVAGGARLVCELSLVRLLVRMAVGARALRVDRSTAPLVTLGTGKVDVLSV